MLLRIPKLLSADEVGDFRALLADADWADGRASAGHLSAKVKRNEQLPADHPVARELGDRVLAKLEREPLFISAALPLKVMPPWFNRYAGGQTYGHHVDGAIQPVPGTGHRIRADLSATVFLSEPAEYEGGELVIEDHFGAHAVKLPAGDMILYPGGSLHTVTPVTAGARLAAFFWVQSMVRDDGERDLLFTLDGALQDLGRAETAHATILSLTNVYHNLLRRWSDV